MKARLTRTTAGLAVGITAAVLAASAAGGYLYSVHHFDALLKAMRATALAEGELVREALEHQMVENDRTLIARMVESFGRRPGVANVMVLDRSGALRYTSLPPDAANELRAGSPTCQACHQYPREQRGSSRVIETRGGSVLRTVIPVFNRDACHRCHDPAHRINGIVIFDRDVGVVRAEMNRDVRLMVTSTGALALVLIVAIALVVRIVVLRRLQRFETTARLIARGDLERRVPAGGSDTISWLAREFNTMADSMSGLLGDVRRERERLDTVINSIDDGIVVLDTERTVIAANQAFLRRSGRSRDAVLGCCCRGADLGGCSVSECPARGCLETGDRQVRICERRTVEGGTAWEEVHASPIYGSSGRVVQVVEVWRDISERRAAEARLAESHRLASLGLLASGFSHELNTPLATILMAVEGIGREAQEVGNGASAWPRISDNAAIAREQVLRCRGITQQFLRLARGQASAVDIVELQASVAAVARLIEPTARAHAVRIHVEPGEAVQVRAGEAELQQALLNLLLNAVQACAEGGRVVVAARQGATAQARISVTDDGCGIAPGQQERIFEPFFSLRPGGTGLGLFLALNFVRAWGGDLLVESAPGRGSTFQIVLPLAEGTKGMEAHA